ncbi:SCO family protein [Alkalibacillus aidingensis]|uniref:SCO family protein n=1 Tax=Alkalibacillus aidingensis TaxID=2747607 RepID=UPI0016613592|nr:SCO family protein [Alkalibacillus aidingensis]
MSKKEGKLSFIIVVIGLTILFIATDSFQAFTAEQARRVQIEKTQPQLKDVTFEDSESETFRLGESEDVYTIVTFIYTRCGDICPAISMNFRDLYEDIPSEFLDEKLQLLTVSFDPEYDTPDQLTMYQQSIGADGETWRIVRIEDQQELQQFLNQAGVIVIPNEEGGFAHNAAFYLIDPNGRLINIFDYDQPESVVNHLEKIF